MPADDLRRRFSTHEVSPGTAERMDDVRAAGLALATTITAGLIDCDDAAAAIDMIDTAVMTANAGLARQGR